MKRSRRNAADERPPEAEPFEFSYRLTGSGWSAATVRIGEAEAELTASYLADALGDLLAAAVAITRGAPEARASWEEEPGEYRWVLRRAGPFVGVRVLWFRDLWSHEPDAAGRECIAGTVSLSELALVIAYAARTVLDEHGVAGYERAWVQHPFPEEALASLEAYVDADWPATP